MKKFFENKIFVIFWEKFLFLVLLTSTKKCHIGRHIHLVSLISTKQKEIQYDKTKRVYSASGSNGWKTSMLTNKTV